MTKACISKTKRAAKIWTLTEAICLSDRKSVRILLELQTPIGLLEQFVDSLQILDWRSWKNIKSIPSYNKVVNFIYSEKATKFCEIFTLVLSYIIVVPVKCKVNILQIAVAFSEYMNFKKIKSILIIRFIYTLGEAGFSFGKFLSKNFKTSDSMPKNQKMVYSCYWS